MDTANLSQADKYLLYGLLLKKRRSPAEERKLIPIIRGSLDLDEKIEAIMALAEEGEKKSYRRNRKGKRPSSSSSGRRGKKKISALVVDLRPELTKLLKKCSLKRRLVFTRIGESFDAIHLLRHLQTKLVVINENLADDDYPRYFEICRAVQPGIKIIYLGSPPRPLPTDPVFRGSARFIQKPISISHLEETVRELLGSAY
ncbi:MAG: hypothetical protein JSV89_08880 [Spirochaetaceae bacterium]|nr:MAG: hypothetical protein JSV89_08880 [Spirochaetaceae bacterium]